MIRSSTVATCVLLLATLSGCGTRDEIVVPLPDLAGAEAEVIEAVEHDIESVRREPDSAEAWGRLGDRYRASNWLPEAASCFARAEELAPSDFLWAYRRGLALMFTEPAAAVEAFDRALRIDPDYVPALIHAAQRLVRLGRSDEARTRYEAALRLDEANAYALVGLGQIALTTGEFERARQRLERARAIDPGLGAAQRGLAQAYLALGDETAASAAAAAAENLPYLSVMADPRASGAAGPVGSVAQVDLGKALLEQGRLQEAVEHLGQALRGDPDSVPAHYAIGVALIQLERYDEAVTHLEAVRRHQPDSPYYFNAMAQLRALEGRDAEAAELWRESVRLDPNDPEAQYALADMLKRLGRPDEAERHFRQSLVLDPQNAVVHFALGAVLNDLGRHDEAATSLGEAVRLGPDDADARFYYGTFLAQRGRAVDAIPHLDAAATLKPDDASIRMNLGLALSRQGSTDRAAAQFREALRLEPQWSRPAARLAWIYATSPEARLRDAAEAVRLAELAVASSRRRDVEALDALAAAYAEAGRFDEAVEVARSALARAADLGRDRLAEAISGRLEQYRERQPYRGK